MKHEKTFAAIEKLKDVELELHRLKNALELANKALDAQPAQEPVAYDKTEMNAFVQDLYDRKMQEEKHGHYETMFHCVHQAIKRIYTTPPAAQPAQEPVAWMNNKDFEPIRVRIMQEAYELADRNDSESYNAIKVMCGDVQRMLPPKRPWVGLTDEEIEKGREQAFRWAENALKEKNA